MMSGVGENINTEEYDQAGCKLDPLNVGLSVVMLLYIAVSGLVCYQGITDPSGLSSGKLCLVDDSNSVVQYTDDDPTPQVTTDGTEQISLVLWFGLVNSCVWICSLSTTCGYTQW
jgi:hypothetical protein